MNHIHDKSGCSSSCSLLRCIVDFFTNSATLACSVPGVIFVWKLYPSNSLLMLDKFLSLMLALVRTTRFGSYFGIAL